MTGVGRYVRQHHLAMVAIFIALSGTAYATATIGKDDIKDNAVRSRHIKDGQVKLGDVDPAVLQGIDAATLNGLTAGDIGLGYFSGRLVDLTTTGGKGAPNGVSTSVPAATAAASTPMTLSPDQDIVARNFAVTLTNPVACVSTCSGSETGAAFLIAIPPVGDTVQFSCVILVTESDCESTGSSAVIFARSQMVLLVAHEAEVTLTAGTDAMFSWQAAAP